MTETMDAQPGQICLQDTLRHDFLDSLMEGNPLRADLAAQTYRQVRGISRQEPPRQTRPPRLPDRETWETWVSEHHPDWRVPHE